MTGFERDSATEHATDSSHEPRIGSGVIGIGEGSSGIRLRYLGGSSALIQGPATRLRYFFSGLQPTLVVDVRDARSMLRTRLFVRAA